MKDFWYFDYAVVGERRGEANRRIVRDRKMRRDDIKEQVVLNEVGKGKTYKVLADVLNCSVGHISEIVKKHGGFAAVRMQYRANRPGAKVLSSVSSFFLLRRFKGFASPFSVTKVIEKMCGTMCASVTRRRAQ